MHSEPKDEYYEWLHKYVCGKDVYSLKEYRQLTEALYNRPFTWINKMDANRAEEGHDLRYRFAIDTGYHSSWVDDYLCEPCNVLEMMVSLAIRIEENIMDDPEIGDRTIQWFWQMVSSLGLSGMVGSRFNPDTVDDVLDTFLNREYESNGKGGLFTIKHCADDLREVEIWHQCCWYLDKIAGL